MGSCIPTKPPLDGVHQLCSGELDEQIDQVQSEGSERIPRDVAHTLTGLLESDMEAGRAFLNELSPTSRSFLLRWSHGNFRGLLYEALENPEGGYLPIDTRPFDPRLVRGYSFFQDYVLLPEEVRPDLPDLAFAAMAQILLGAVDEVSADRFQRFLDSLHPEARARLDAHLPPDLSRVEQLYNQMQHSVPDFDWSSPLTKGEVSEFVSFDPEVGLMKEEAFATLAQHYSFPLPSPDLVEMHLVSSDVAEQEGNMLAWSSENRVYLRLPGAEVASTLKAAGNVVHEIAHAVFYLMHQQAVEEHGQEGAMEHPTLPMWFHEALAMEVDGSIEGSIRETIWSHRLGSSDPYHPEPVESFSGSNYDFAEAFYAVWTESLGPSAWQELAQEVLTTEPDLYKAIAKVAERHGLSGFENEGAVRATVYRWMDQVALEISDEMLAYHESIESQYHMRGDFLTSRLEDFADSARTAFQENPDLSGMIAGFVRRHPNTPLNIQYHALLMVQAFDANDAGEASRHLQAIRSLLEHYDIRSENLNRTLVKLDALAALMEGDYDRFIADMDSLVLPGDSFYVRQINEEISCWRQRALEGDLNLLEDFRRSLFPPLEPGVSSP